MRSPRRTPRRPGPALRLEAAGRGCGREAARQIKNLVVTAPEGVRTMLRHLKDKDLLAVCAGFRPDPGRASDPVTATKIALRSLARRHRGLGQEIDELDELTAPLTRQINPALAELNGVGPDVAGQLLVTAGDNPDRLRSEAAFAMLCGVAPLPASSGRTHRHRLDRGGDRAANAAFYRIVLCRLRWDSRTRAYMARRTKEGLSKKEIIRCLKRFVARELYNVLIATNATTAASSHLTTAA